MEGPHKVYGDSNSPRETNNSIDLLEVAADAEKEGKDGGVEIVKVKHKSSWSETINVEGDSIMAIFSKILRAGL